MNDDDDSGYRRRLRYVVLHHVGIDVPHFDIMLEREPADSPGLRTFRSPAWPIESETPLTELPDHRRAYLDYEGPVSGDRGSVTRVEAGEYSLVRNPPRDRSAHAKRRMSWQVHLWHDNRKAVFLVTLNEREEWVARPFDPGPEA